MCFTVVLGTQQFVSAVIWLLWQQQIYSYVYNLNLTFIENMAVRTAEHHAFAVESDNYFISGD